MEIIDGRVRLRTEQLLKAWTTELEPYFKDYIRWYKMKDRLTPMPVEEQIKNAKEAGIYKMIVCGGNREDNDHIIKLDERTLPKNKELDSQNPVLIRTTEGLLSKVNFPIVEAKPGKPKKVNKVELPFFKDDYFLVLLGAMDISKFSTDGDISIVSEDDRFENKWHIDNRLAFYLKGKIKGEYIITSSLNTERENQEFMRYIDPDKYYPIYGDIACFYACLFTFFPR